MHASTAPPGELSATLLQALQAEALRLGFQDLGAVAAAHLPEEQAQYEAWLAQGGHADMHYLEAYAEVRFDPRRLFPGASTLLMVTLGYDPGPERQPPPLPVHIARYAWGRDYHAVIRERLKLLLRFLRSQVASPLQAQICVDGAPVLEKVWARRAGLGWQGKHTNLIHPQRGSWFLLGTLVLSLPLAAELLNPAPIPDYCGTCTRCLDVCPTQALRPYEIDAPKCISYQTIERKAPITESLRPHLAGWAFGCDLCQEVCPWNRFSQPHRDAALEPLPLWEKMSAWALAETTGRQFRKRTTDSPVHRIYRAKWLDNLQAAEASLGDAADMHSPD